jgi:hypothetical protein
MESTDLNAWWGVAAGIACGLGARNIGTVVGTAGAAGAAVVVGACLIMLLDAFSG